MSDGSVRQGDVLLVPVTGPEKRRLLRRLKSAVAPGPRGLVLAEGEATGHAHVVKTPGAVLFMDEKLNELFLRVGDRNALVEHDEHRALTLKRRALYRVLRQREYDPAKAVARARFVAD